VVLEVVVVVPPAVVVVVGQQGAAPTVRCVQLVVVYSQLEVPQ